MINGVSSDNVSLEEADADNGMLVRRSTIHFRIHQKIRITCVWWMKRGEARVKVLPLLAMRLTAQRGLLTKVHVLPEFVSDTL